VFNLSVTSALSGCSLFFVLSLETSNIDACPLATESDRKQAPPARESEEAMFAITLIVAVISQSDGRDRGGVVETPSEVTSIDLGIHSRKSKGAFRSFRITSYHFPCILILNQFHTFRHQGMHRGKLRNEDSQRCTLAVFFCEIISRE